MESILEIIKDTKEGEEYLTFNYLLPAHSKVLANQIKYAVEQEVPGIKIFLTEPVHPRKNTTLTISGVKEHLLLTKSKLPKIVGEVSLK